MNMDHFGYEGYEIAGRWRRSSSRGTVLVSDGTYHGRRVTAGSFAVAFAVSGPRGRITMRQITTGSAGRSPRQRDDPVAGLGSATGEQQAESSRRPRRRPGGGGCAGPPSRLAAASLSRRAEVMFRFRELIDANRKEIAGLSAPSTAKRSPTHWRGWTRA